MTKAMPFLQKAILLSYDPRRLASGRFFCAKKHLHRGASAVKVGVNSVPIR